MTAKPPIILITCDQLRRDALSCYGQTAIATPHLDRLAAQSWSFDRAYANSPVCLPSRCALATGRLPHNNRAYSNFREVRPNPDEPTLYNQLRAVGYRTGHIGKCHYTPAPYHLIQNGVTQDFEPVKDFYMSLGMDHLDLQNGKLNSIWFWNDYSREMEAAGHLAAYRHAIQHADQPLLLPFPGLVEWHPDAWVGRKGVEWIRSQTPDCPSFSWISFSGPHYPEDPPPEYLDRVNADALPPLRQRDGDFEDRDKVQWNAWHGEPGMGVESASWVTPKGCKHLDPEYIRQFRLHYLANVALLDNCIGQVLDAVEQSFGDKALVLFTADHGEMAGDHGLVAKNACAYEQNLRVPLTVRFPGQTEGKHFDGLVQLIDLLPTALCAAGADIPESLDGRPLQESLETGGHPCVISEMDGFLAVCDGRYRYAQLAQPDGLRAELFDLEKDPDEFDNLLRSPEHAEILARLRGALVDRFAQDLLL